MAFQDFSEYSVASASIEPLRYAFVRATAIDFANQVRHLHKEPRFQRNISLKEDYTPFECWLTPDRAKGFAVGVDNELTNVFSALQAVGGGKDVMKFVTSRYDFLHLNCYEGRLERFYARHGFEVTRRERNWNGEGHPAIVYMQWNR